MNKLFLSTLATLAFCVVAANAADSNPKKLTGLTLIAQVCKKATNKDLCSSRLTADPGTKNADLTKLTLISIRLATFSAIDTSGFIAEMQKDKSLDLAVSHCYSDCFDNYSGAVEQLDDSLAALIAKKYVDVKKRIQTAYLFEDACEVCFKATTHTKTISGRNRMFRHLCMNALSLVDALQGPKP